MISQTEVSHRLHLIVLVLLTALMSFQKVVDLRGYGVVEPANL